MADAAWPFYVSAAIAGAAFGYVIQRGGFCLMRALANLFLMGDTAIARAYVLALLVAMASVQALSAAGLVEFPIRPFHWMSNSIGGLVFGVGMVLAGGCSGSTWYRVGEGAVGAWVILLGFAMGATTVRLGSLSPLRAALQVPTITIGDAPPTLATALGVSPWLVIAALWVVGGIWLVRARGQSHHGKWPWHVTGAAVGVLIAAGWWASTVGEPPVGLTFAVNTGELLTYPLVGFPNRVNWSMVMLVAVPVGAFAAAWPSGDFRWKLPPGWSLVKIFSGGLLMGGSAILAEGCNITQGLTNGSTLALGSLVTLASMLVGGWLTLRALYGTTR
ncbi:MAG: YeeE/YedE family protein [Candidatus Rokubacteria bacterium]|nr:YeeE/YedE family protein [Candidatus Rokubacteria bacterium]